MKNRIHRQLENAKGTYALQLRERVQGDPKRFWKEKGVLLNLFKHLTVQLVNELTGETIPIDETAEYYKQL